MCQTDTPSSLILLSSCPAIKTKPLIVRPKLDIVRTISNFVYRVKMTVDEAENVSLKALLGDKLTCEDVTLNTGDEYYIDLKMSILH